MTTKSLDSLGREFHPGQVIMYPTRRSCKLNVKFALVKDLITHEVEDWVLDRNRGSKFKRPITVTQLRVEVVSRFNLEGEPTLNTTTIRQLGRTTILEGMTWERTISMLKRSKRDDN